MKGLVHKSYRKRVKTYLKYQRRWMKGAAEMKNFGDEYYFKLCMDRYNWVTDRINKINKIPHI